MKVRSVHFWIAVLSLVAVVGMAVVDLRRTSPGELTRVHARDEKLDGGSNCSACHGGFFSGMTASCLECHAAITDQIEGSKGLHGTIEKVDAERCSSCHSEHHGPGFSIVNRQSFALAGVADPREFDHRRIGWEMNGAHLEISCTDCHANALADVLPPGGVRYLGLAQDCGSCHDDPHEGRMRVSCASCHGQETWEKMDAEGHEEHLPLIGGHGGLDCRTCHAKDSPRALEAMERELAFEPRTCADCHDSPHSEPFVVASARESSLAFEASCVACHAAEHDTFRDERLVLTPEQHAASGFSLALPHDAQTCGQCHDPFAAEFAQRYPGREQDRCSACHEDVHAGQFAEGPFSTGDCLACHERTAWEPHTFELAKHSLAEFALTGSHTDTECALCHQDPDPFEPVRRFRGIDSTCEACHRDVHSGMFEVHASVLSPLPAGACARCHDTTKFEAVPPERFDHGAWTTFALEGAHEQESCEACHLPRPAPDTDGRKFGRVEDRFGLYEGCYTCHADPHDKRFDGPLFPQEVEGKRDCARCHASTSFRTLWQGFDHGRWTGFELRQGHAKSACADCHTPRNPPDANGKSWEPALGPGCADCHDNPHGDQFGARGKSNCSACHDEEARNYSTFDHERGSRFPLGETHRNVACSACHQPEPLSGVKNGAATVRYKPLGIECADCHGVHDEVLLRRKPGNK